LNQRVQPSQKMSSIGEGESSTSALWQSFAMIIVSEIGDKTFLIAAILSMRHPRLVVFAGAFSSLLVMSVLSAAMGHVLPTLISRRWTQLAAAVLFLVFGLKMLKEGREMQGGNEKIQEELREVEEEIALKDVEGGSRNLTALEGGQVHTGGSSTPKSKEQLGNDLGEGAKNIASLFLGPVFLQAFILTFLGEWGDRSQIATIALAAAHVRRLTNPEGPCSSPPVRLQNVYVVTIGTVVGHSCCTALAVLGGRWLSTKISIKHGMSLIRSTLKPPSLTIRSNAWRSGPLHPLRPYLLPRSNNLC
jgi:putative Ca2+/H+ antiporter (TMEM165/GDT1 family)